MVIANNAEHPDLKIPISFYKTGLPGKRLQRHLSFAVSMFDIMEFLNAINKKY